MFPSFHKLIISKQEKKTHVYINTKILKILQIIRPRLNEKRIQFSSLITYVKKKGKERSIIRFGNGDTHRFNEFHRESDRYRYDRKIQLFSFYFFIQRKSVS